jgi:cytochrome c-type biogenesis protein CcsB
MSDFQLAMTNTAGISSLMSFWVFVGSNAFNRTRELMLRLGRTLLIVGFVSLTAAIILRGFDAERFPLANLYESLLWFAWAIMGGYLLLTYSYQIKQLGWLASLTAAVMFLYGSWLPSSQHEVSPLVPALVSYWRQIHVPPLVVSYAMFFLGGLSSLLHLWFSGRTRSLGYAITAIILAVSAIALGTYTQIESYWLQILFVGGSLGGISASWFSLSKLNAKTVNSQYAELYDEVSHRCVSIGFPLLTIGIITGGLWANHAWGSYWSWDPKESMALVTLICYAVYIHLRIHREVSASKLALVAIGGLLLVLLTYLGFNSLGFGGLHSYGRFKS